ncbi:hypothetical protein Q0Z83_112050 [Actinoplanes sichuanensis]|uniref:Transcriptional regulator n=1 Tax=Actinoplanes sichuanensis TaxID=512349 RepID=A0ABW4A211_9ACTN|nr:hypothetical protein [Actinoplanes sichuanensis]BEL13014.1 hypothetical protein Q0Z83_112050 [Actinoplanes sichuanensis]
MPGQHRPTNAYLAGLIAEAEISHGALARMVNQLGRRPEHGSLDLRYDSSSVNRWLRGALPTPPAPTLIAAVLSHKLARTIDPGHLAGGDAFLELPANTDETVRAATGLWHQAAHRRDALRYPFVSQAGPQAGWRWAFGSADAAVIGRGTRGVGMSDVQRLRTARDDFADLDRRHGGGYARSWLTDFLDREVTPLLHGRYRDAVGTALFSIAANLTETVSYMAFDDGEHGLAQRLSIQSLALAKHSGDTAFGAYVMSNMAAQLVFLGDGRTAAQMARAAACSAGQVSGPLLARIYTTEARGHALAGDTRGCRNALAQAEHAMNTDGMAPAWLGASSFAHQAGSAMHCLHDLGLHTEAVRHSTAALDLPHDSIRARALHEIVLARVYLGLRDVDRSCETARPALHSALQLRSRRLRERLHEYASALAAHRKHPAAQAWRAEAREILAAA